MKARVKATGEIVEAMYSHTTPHNERVIDWYVTLREANFTEDELEFIDNGESLDYWTRLEHQAAIAAMQGMLAEGQRSNKSYISYSGIVELSIGYARALVEKMKEEMK